jgi:hypothetical protein
MWTKKERLLKDEKRSDPCLKRDFSVVFLLFHKQRVVSKIEVFSFLVHKTKTKHEFFENQALQKHS